MNLFEELDFCRRYAPEAHNTAFKTSEVLNSTANRGVVLRRTPVAWCKLPHGQICPSSGPAHVELLFVACGTDRTLPAFLHFVESGTRPCVAGISQLLGSRHAGRRSTNKRIAARKLALCRLNNCNLSQDRVYCKPRLVHTSFTYILSRWDWSLSSVWSYCISCRLTLDRRPDSISYVI